MFVDVLCRRRGHGPVDARASVPSRPPNAGASSAPRRFTCSTRELAEAPDLAQLLAVMIYQVGETFRADVALSLPEGNGQRPAPRRISPAPGRLSEKEQSVAAWSFQHRQPAGPRHGHAELVRRPAPAARGGRTRRRRVEPGFPRAAPLPPAQRDLLDAFVRQIALVLDRQRLRDTETQAELLAESERLGKTLFNSVDDLVHAAGRHHQRRRRIARRRSAEPRAAGACRRARRGGVAVEPPGAQPP